MTPRAVLAALLLVACRSVAAASFSFALLGDTPYSPEEEASFTAMLHEIDGEDVAFVAHVGDFKHGWTWCGDEVLIQRRRMFDEDFRVGGRDRTFAAIFLSLLTLFPAYLLVHKSPPTNSTMAKSIVGLCAVLALFLFVARRRFLANRISRLSWLTIFVSNTGLIVVHIAAERIGVPLSMALIADSMILASSTMVFVLTAQRAFLVAAAGFFVNGLLIVGWPERGGEISFVCVILTLIGNVLSVAWASRSTSPNGV